MLDYSMYYRRPIRVDRISAELEKFDVFVSAFNSSDRIGRVFTDTFAGINPTSALPFIAAQLLGGGVGTALAIALFPNTSRVPD